MPPGPAIATRRLTKHFGSVVAVEDRLRRRATATAVAGAAAVGTFLLQTLVAVVDGVAPDALIVPLAVSAVLVAAGLRRFDRRDLR